MKKMFLGLTLATLCGLPVLAALKTGDSAPDFSARASLAGKEFNFSLKKALKKGPVVVYFYPSAYTKGCDLEAHTFAQEKEKFDAAGATIIGVSADSVDASMPSRPTLSIALENFRWPPTRAARSPSLTIWLRTPESRA